MSARTRRAAVGRGRRDAPRLAAGPPFFRPDWPFSPPDDASLFDAGRRRAFLCAQVGRIAPSTILIGASRMSRVSVERSARTLPGVVAAAVAAAAAGATSPLLPLPSAAAPRPRLRRLGNQVEPRASRAGYGARRRVGTRGRRAREEVKEREKTYTKAAIFRKGNQRRAFRAAYHRATSSPLPSPPPLL